MRTAQPNHVDLEAPAFCASTQVPEQHPAHGIWIDYVFSSHDVQRRTTPPETGPIAAFAGLADPKLRAASPAAAVRLLANSLESRFNEMGLMSGFTVQLHSLRSVDRTRLFPDQEGLRVSFLNEDALERFTAYLEKQRPASNLRPH